MSIFRYGRPITVATQGLLASQHPLTVSTQGILEPLQVVVDADLYFGGDALVYFDLQYAVVEQDLIFNGEAATTLAIAYTASGGIILNGTATAAVDQVYEYAADGGIVLNGAADAAATIVVTYDANGGIVVNGDAIEAFVEPVHTADGGIILNGSAIVTPIGFEKERSGGGGTPRRRRFYENAHIWTYQAGYEPVRTTFLHERERKRTDHLIGFNGEAIARFVPPKYLLIPTLPKLPKPEIQGPSEFLQLYFDVSRKSLAPRFTHVAGTRAATKISGTAPVVYFDYGDFIITADDEMMLLGMLDSLDPAVIATRFDRHAQRIRDEEEELIRLGLL